MLRDRMLAARIHQYGHGLVVEEMPTPTPGPGEVVIRVDAAGFCHSDIHVLDGEIPILPRMPLVLGHENAGTVALLGAGVTSVREGDSVAVFGGWGCGRCSYCVSGEEQLCGTPAWPGLSLYDGGYAQYMLVPHERYLVPLTTLSPIDAAPLTDAALTPYRAIKKAREQLQPDAWALVIGLGGLGQYGLKLLRVLSACPVIAVDVHEEKLALAKQLGAEEVLDGRRPDLADAIQKITRGRGVGASFDFVGSDTTLALAVQTTCSGGKVSHVGLAGGTVKLQPLVTSKFEVSYEATLWGTIKELREVIALAEGGRLTPIPVERAALKDINRVYERLKRGEVRGRAVITPNA